MHIEDYELLPPEHPLYSVTRYTFLKGEDIKPPVPAVSSVLKARDGEPPDENYGSLGYQREPKFIQVKKKHREIQKLLVRKLRVEYDHDSVTWEHPLENGTYVDVARTEDDQIIYYEIKTFPSVRLCIREAMGQLLEYAHWCNVQIPKELIIVSDLDLGDGLDYLRKIRERYKLPINYQRLDIESQTLSSPVF